LPSKEPIDPRFVAPSNCVTLGTVTWLPMDGKGVWKSD
jgi:hypothetical protein